MKKKIKNLTSKEVRKVYKQAVAVHDDGRSFCEDCPLKNCDKCIDLIFAFRLITKYENTEVEVEE